MKLRFFFTTLLALCVAGASAQKAKKATKKKAEVAEAPAAAPVDTVSLKDFSYAMGVAQVSGLKMYLAQSAGVDTVNNMNDVVRGISEMFSRGNEAKFKAYSVGLQIGQQIAEQFLAQINKQITGNPNASFVDVDRYKAGFLAGITGQGLTMMPDSAAGVAQKQMQYYKEQLNESLYGENRRAGEAFLAENAKNDSVKTTPSGLQYKILKQGTGAKPQATSQVKVNYEGTLVDGTVFDSSYKRGQPATFGCGQVIKGWTEALQMMPVGSTWMVYIPYELGYGTREMGTIKPYSALIFKVELLEIVEGDGHNH